MERTSFTTKLAMLAMGGLLFAEVALGAQTPIDLTIHGNDEPLPGTTGHGKAPSILPSLWQEGHELTFQATHVDYAIDVVQNGIVVYSLDVDESTSSVMLPSWLSGDFEILLYPEDSDYYFYGVISL